MLYGYLGVDTFSTFLLQYQIMKVGLRVIRTRFDFYLFSDNPNVSDGSVDCSLHVCRMALADNYHEK